MRVLAVDIGTNSTLHLVADVDGGKLTLIERGIAGNRLGAGRAPDGSLPPELITHNRAILERILVRGRELGCRAGRAVGTHALRTAPNGDDFLHMAGELGLPVEIVDGEREAHLAWRGVFGPSGPGRPAALLDIGGGSSELMIGIGEEPEWSESLPIGAVTLTGMFASDPPRPTEAKSARQLVREALSPWRGSLPKSVRLVGVAGTVTALAALERRLASYTPGALEGDTLRLQTIARWRDRLVRMPLAERESLPGMPPARAKVIPAGAVILSEVMKLLGRRTLRVSERGVMFGLAWEMGAGQ